MKPIEPNDIVLIIAGDEFTGRVCTAIEKVMCSGGTGWRLDPSILRESEEHVIMECGLKRLNDPDIQKQIEEETVIWNGESIPVTGVIS